MPVKAKQRRKVWGTNWLIDTLLSVNLQKLQDTKKLYYKQTLFTGWQCVKCKNLHSRCSNKIHMHPQETWRSVCIVIPSTILVIDPFLANAPTQRFLRRNPRKPEVFFLLSTGGYNGKIDIVHKWVGYMYVKKANN